MQPNQKLVTDKISYYNVIWNVYNEDQSNEIAIEAIKHYLTRNHQFV